MDTYATGAGLAREGRECAARELPCHPGVLQQDPASFDRLRMRTFLGGIYQGPFAFSLILSLSKDAKLVLQHSLHGFRRHTSPQPSPPLRGGEGGTRRSAEREAGRVRWGGDEAGWG